MHFTRTWGVASETFTRSLVGALPVDNAVVAVRAPRAAGINVLEPRLLRTLPPGMRRRWFEHRLRAVVDDIAPQVVHAHFRYRIELATRLAERASAPLVVSVHGHDVLASPGAEVWGRHLRGADLVTVPSRFLGHHVLSLGVDPGRLRVLNAGVRLRDHPFAEVVPPSHDEPTRLLFVGRFVPKKGVDDLLTALSRLRTKHHVALTLVGYGELADELRRRIAQEDLPATLVDGRDRGAVRAAFAGAHVVVTPSRTAADGDAETLCYVNVEAQARGLPVVTTRHGGIPEGVAPEAAVLVPEGDPRSLATAIDALLDHPEEWAAMGRAGRAFVEDRFDLDRNVVQYVDHYRSLVTSGAPAPGGDEW